MPLPTTYQGAKPARATTFGSAAPAGPKTPMPPTGTMVRRRRDHPHGGAADDSRESSPTRSHGDNAEGLLVVVIIKNGSGKYIKLSQKRAKEYADECVRAQAENRPFPSAIKPHPRKARAQCQK